MAKKVKVLVDVTEIGRKGGLARSASLSDAEKSASSRNAARARWDRYYAAHPEKRKTARTGASRKKAAK